MKLNITLEDRDHAIIMAALRHAQNDPSALTAFLKEHGWGAPTNRLEIDDLAGRFDCEAEEES